MAFRVCTIGQLGHGKTTLKTALAQSQSNTAAPLDKNGIVYDATRVQYQTPTRQYDHVDFAGPSDATKYFITQGSALNAVILVVSATEGPTQQVRDQLLLAKQVGLTSIVLLLNKTDLIDDDGVLDLVEDDVRELVIEYDFVGADMPVVRGSALKAAQGTDKSTVAALLQSLDAFPQHNNEQVTSANVSFKFEALVSLRTTAEGGRRTPFYQGYIPRLKFPVAGKTILGKIEFTGGVTSGNPGAVITLKITLFEGLNLSPKTTRFSIEEGGIDIGHGVVTRVG
ncbi:hypothetical protein DYB25_012894 [Aphanomyces astaci]|uniref:Elongation factor Tu, chloroplastic n=1 Tax=Aphanomyces astaci TaxID=112090 RepID=A0A397C1J4_APHAT|nr:hypothetical protein DYB25_012894 [Aphanomyces astaci]